MTKQQHVIEAVARHGWANLKDWATALEELADLTDEQIDQVAECALGRNSPCKPESP